MFCIDIEDLPINENTNVGVVPNVDPKDMDLDPQTLKELEAMLNSSSDEIPSDSSHKL